MTHTHTHTPLTHGDIVTTPTASIDGRKATGLGRVDGFARFSAYHPREVSVTALDGSWSAWFWERDVAKARGEGQS